MLLKATNLPKIWIVHALSMRNERTVGITLAKAKILDQAEECTVNLSEVKLR